MCEGYQLRIILFLSWLPGEACFQSWSHSCNKWEWFGSKNYVKSQYCKWEGKIMWNHFTVVSADRTVCIFFNKQTKNYVKSHYCCLNIKTSGEKNYVKSQPICVLMLEQFGLTEKILSNHSTLSAHFKRNKISPKTKNYVKPM